MKEGSRKGFNIRKIIPNIITMSAALMGLEALMLAVLGDYRRAAGYVVLACLLDKFDGKVARMLGVSSEFGAQMDSLADFFNFGVVPGFVVYMWKMQDYSLHPHIAWLPVQLLTICMAIRLARFNVSLAKEDPDNPLNKYFFRGIPAPMAACLVLFPMILSFEYPNLNFRPSLVIINTILVAIMAASTIPTPCFKKIKFNDNKSSLYEFSTILFNAVIALGLLVKTWCTATIICILYLVSIVLSWFFYYKFWVNSKKSSQR
ncbi:MAG: phosphatidylcholine/phosphatidylserine synthase [Rickettsiales bacterium]|jgi:CDP-diacylglycerol--serine O-phosphatidyltransferase|nr:phosphatidylcholine/phosphatidylserine synthase [Rickettsiales bacterium]